ncbi:uncharacterized protein (DUF58 family) [Nocardioides ginsengisegetis]|uniref:Uncharacterized protein (DUF58 family) n=1 Tax=Nocardioides ginsengisegetis TaxID=661491 RepID=A0A7W3IWR6_9ACTN|nr:DUF58 domain-containing protein [Nocardioides ginsengisegetis]MBA8802051.1 uncharacterized protein (DUF58 family) [Nocardioides ginsengisegetis]
MALSGRVPLLLLLGLVPVVLRPSLGTVWLWVLAVGVAVLVDWVVAPPPASVTMHRRPVGTVRMGHPTETLVVATNDGRRTVTALVRDAWQPTAGASDNRHRVRLGPGDRVLLRTPLQPRRRGDLRAIGVTVRSRGPLGLAARQRTIEVAGAVRSLPPFESRKHLPSRLARLRELDGRAAVRVRGQGTEFDSLREYVRGDDVRSIDWRASARNRNVVVRTWQPERDRRVVLVLDTSRTSAGRVDDVPRLDSAMDAALLLAALAARAGDRIDFVAGDRRVRSRLRSAGARDVSANLQEAMADLEPVIAEADWTSLAGAVTGFGRQRALVVLLTPLEPSAVEEGLLPVLPALTRHHRVVLASVKDPALEQLAATRGTVDEVYDAAAAEQVLVRRRHTADLLRALGVDVVDADAERLPPALADHYLALKARGLL